MYQETATFLIFLLHWSLCCMYWVWCDHFTLPCCVAVWSFRPYKLWLWQHVARETENLNTEFKNVQQDAEIQYYILRCNALFTSTRLHGVTSQKVVLFVFTTVFDLLLYNISEPLHNMPFTRGSHEPNVTVRDGRKIRSSEHNSYSLVY
jgi:hypothetical protein